MVRQLLGILISGTSHVGKSTLAEKLADRLGWSGLSTDKLGRHPGRPWLAIPPPVAEFYTKLSPETIHWFLKVHHENMWPAIRQRIEAERSAGLPFVLEGAALRPEYIAPLVSDQIFGVLLHADDAFLVDRIRSAADYPQRGGVERGLIDAFIDRSLRENAAFYGAAQEAQLKIVDAADERAVADLFDELVNRASGGPSPEGQGEA